MDTKPRSAEGAYQDTEGGSVSQDGKFLTLGHICSAFSAELLPHDHIMQLKQAQKTAMAVCGEGEGGQMFRTL